MRVRFRMVALSLLLIVGSGCAHLRLEKVLRAYRETPEWIRSREAFKTILRKHAHSGLETATEEELNRYYEQFLLLDQQDVERFMRSQGCLPTSGTAESTYYLIHADHRRHDTHFATEQALPVAGTGMRALSAAFSATAMFQRYALDASVAPPKRAIRGPFPTWNSLKTALSDRTAFASTFKFRDPAQADAVFAVTSATDWSQAQAQLFMAPELAGGAVFSPALFAVYLFRPTPAAPYGLYLVVSASGGGEAKQPFVGLIPGPEMLQSTTGFAFTYLSSADNLLDYSVEVVNPATGATRVTITTAYPGHPDTPYLTVETNLVPSPDDAAAKAVTRTPGINVLMMVRKGALMRDLIAAYYPESSELDLWTDVGAFTADPTFKSALQAAGLDVPVDVLGVGGWGVRPTVGDTLAPLDAPELPCTR